MGAQNLSLQSLHGYISPCHLRNEHINGSAGCHVKVQVELLSGCDAVSMCVHTCGCIQRRPAAEEGISSSNHLPAYLWGQGLSLNQKFPISLTARLAYQKALMRDLPISLSASAPHSMRVIGTRCHSCLLNGRCGCGFRSFCLSSKYYPPSNLSGFNFLTTSKNAFQSCCSILHCHQQRTKIVGPPLLLDTANLFFINW